MIAMTLSAAEAEHPGQRPADHTNGDRQRDLERERHVSGPYTARAAAKRPTHGIALVDPAAANE
jgi:hypothetical protein